MRRVDVAGVSYASGGPGEAYYACAPCGEDGLAFLFFDGLSAFWSADRGKAGRDLHGRFHEVAAEPSPDWGARARALIEQQNRETWVVCSVVVGRVDAARREMVILNAGKGGTTYLRREQPREVEHLAVTGPVVGVVDAVEWGVHRGEIHAGDLLLVTTPEVSEALDMPPPLVSEDRVVRILEEDAPADGSARAWLRWLFQEVDRHDGPRAAAPVALALVLREWAD